MDVNQIYFLGLNKYGQAGIGQDQHNKKYLIPKQIVFKTFIKQVSCGNHHSALLTIDGLIYTMGSNIHGTLGLGNSGNVNYAFRPTLIKQLKDVDQVVSGSYHMCAIKQGQLYTWGKGIDGQLGHGNMKNVFTPTKIQSLGNMVESVSCGMNHTLVTVNKSSDNFNGYAFGSGIYGQLGCGSNRSYNYPINIKLQDIQSISAGQNHSLFISKGQVYGCGDNSFFQIGCLEDNLKNKRYILQPVKINHFSNIQINFINCYNLSVALTTQNKAYLWGGKQKVWPPIQIDEKEIVNIKVTNQKIYYINGENQLISYMIGNSPKFLQQKQIIFKHKNILDFDAGQYHMIAAGDIVAQTEDKKQTSVLSLWVGQSLTSSKQSFSQKIIKSSTQNLVEQQKIPIHKKIPQYYFTKHLKSGISQDSQFQEESQNISRKIKEFSSFQESALSSMQNNNSTLNSKAFENISSQIEVQSRHPMQINESQTKRYFQDKIFLKTKENDLSNDQKTDCLANSKIFSSVSDNKKYSETKLQKLMDQMQLKTVHLKRHSQAQNKLIQQSKKIHKTPSSYIKKEPQNFVIGSEQINDYPNEDPKISSFEEKVQNIMPLKQIYPKNIKKTSKQEKQSIKVKPRARSIIYYNQKENLSQSQQQKTGGIKQLNQLKQKKQGSSIQAIFIQLLNKQRKQKLSNSKSPRLTTQIQNEQQTQKSKRSHSCIVSKFTEPSTSRISKQFQQSTDMPQLVPIKNVIRTPYNQNKMTISKISDNSQLSKKSNFRRNTDLMEISRSNRELRFQLRDRDLKISQLQQDLSKKQIEVQMLYKQLQYFKNLMIGCKNCGYQNSIQDPFQSL